MREEISRAVAALRQGGLLLYPTDTIWGLGCDATRPEAVERLYALKRRETSQQMLVLMENTGWLERYVREVPDMAYQLFDVAVKPLTLVLPGARNLAPNLTGEDGSIGIRIPQDPFCQELLRAFRKPIVSTSANLHGMPPARVYGEMAPEILAGVDYAVGWRREETVSHAAPSSVIKLGADGTIEIIRP
ncbi:MAG: threonylcarbamoyl-AMP synthase [Bacteroidales bacterium]|nr:threonylcarbamoyl-AMP synthase [Bacteroidales bacterium]